MVKAALDQKCHILGRIPANVKFEVVQQLADGSYMSWIAPDRKSKKKGAISYRLSGIEDYLSPIKNQIVIENY